MKINLQTLIKSQIRALKYECERTMKLCINNYRQIKDDDFINNQIYLFDII